MDFSSLDLSSFVEKELPVLLATEEEVVLTKLAKKCRHILDPCSGFLNLAFKNDEQNHNFFSKTSPDNETEFGQNLAKLRNGVFQKAQQLLDKIPEQETQNLYFYVNSILNDIQNTIVPPYFRVGDFVCGFPFKPEICISISRFQDRTVFTQPRENEQSDASASLQKWASIFNHEKTIGSDELNLDIKYTHEEPLKNTVNNMFLKLIPFLNLDEIPEQFLQKLIHKLLYTDLPASSFLLVLIQYILLIYPQTTTTIFKTIFSMFQTVGQIDNGRLHLLVLSIARFTEVLHCHIDRMLHQEDLELLDILSLLILCAPNNALRDTGLKLAFALDRYETGLRESFIFNLFDKISQKVKTRFISYLECYPLLALLHPTDIYSIPSFKEMLKCKEELMWQIMLSGFCCTFSDSFTECFNKKLLRICYKVLQNMDRTTRFGRRFSINLLTLLVTDIKNYDKCENCDLTKIIKNIAPMNIESLDTDETNSNKENENLGTENEKEDVCGCQQKKESAKHSRIGSLSGYATEEVENDELTFEEKLKQIAKMILENVSASMKDFYPALYFLFVTMHESFFNPILEEITTGAYDIEVICAALRGLCWNVNFTKQIEQPEMLTKLQSIFSKIVNKVNEILFQGEIRGQNVPRDIKKNIEKNYLFLRDYALSAYQLLHFLKNKYSTQPNAPFPCFNAVTKVDNKECLAMEPSFDSLFMIATQEFNDPDKHLHLYTTKAISLWLAVCKLKKTDLLNPMYFINQVEKFNNVTLLANALTHQFTTFYPIYLKKSVSTTNNIATLYFDALCKFFRAPHKMATSPTSVLMEQWKAIAVQQDDIYESAAQKLYEEGGNFIASCLLYLVNSDKRRRDKSFIMLASIIPILIVYHDRCPADKLADILNTLKDFSALAMTTECVSSLSTKISEYASFMAESVIDRYTDAIHNRSKASELDRLLLPILPWITSIQLDLENRVVSKNTDFVFLRFSCSSLVEKLLSVFEPLSSRVEDSLGILMWQSLAKKSNFEFIINTLLHLVLQSNKHAPSTVMAIIETLYVSDPEATLYCLVQHLSFMYWLHNSVFTKHRLAVKSTASIKLTEVTDKVNKLTHGKLILKILLEISKSSAAALLNYLPTLCSFVLLHQKDTVRELLRKILIEIEAQLGRNAPRGIHMVVHVVGPSRSEIAKSYYKLLVDYDKKLADEFALELLRWALCCGSLKRATYAVEAYSGLPLPPPEQNVIGAFARSLWIVTSALYESEEYADEFSKTEFNYIAAIIHEFQKMAETSYEKGVLTHNPALFWVPAEALKCNSDSMTPIFHEALKALCFLLDKREIFSNIINNATTNDKEHESAYPVSLFMKYMSPWHESIQGFAKYILNCTCQNYDVSLATKALGLLIQSKFPDFFSRSPTWCHLAALSLLPWMWVVSTNDYPDAIYTTDSVSQLTGISKVLSKAIGIEEVTEALEHVSSFHYNELYNSVRVIATKCGERISEDEMVSLGNWYTNLLKFGDQILKIPIYTIISYLADVNSKVDIIQVMPELIYYAYNDESPEYEPFVEQLKNSVGKTPPQSQTRKRLTFPNMQIFQRIVVCDVPSMYEYEALGETEVYCQDVNSLVPIAPNSHILKETETVHKIRDALAHARYPPFDEWSDMLRRGNTNMLGVTSVNEVRLTPWNAGATISQAMRSMYSSDNKSEDSSSEEEEEDLPDPMSIIPIRARSFLPSMDDVNEVGAALFDESQSDFYQ